MRRILLLFFFFSFTGAFGQSYYFPADYRKDIPTLSEKIPALALLVLKNEPHKTSPEYYDLMIKELTVAKKYDEALLYLDSLRNLFVSYVGNKEVSKGIAFHVEIFLRAGKAKNTTENLPLDSIVENEFQKGFSILNDSAKMIMAASLQMPDKEVLKQNIEKAISKIKSPDSVSQKEANGLLISYYSYLLADPVKEIARLNKDQESKIYDIQKEWINTTDGAKIQAWVVKKKKNAAITPTIFTFNIYADSASDIMMGKVSADLGYVGVVANTRGIGIDNYPIEPFEYDAKDSYDIIEWISRQPWSDGRVGMEGGSYLGFTTWSATKHLHPALKTIVPMVAVAPGTDYPMMSNIFMSFSLRWLDATLDKNTELANRRFMDENLWAGIFRKWYSEGRSFRSLDTIAGMPNMIFQRWLNHPGYDSFWNKMIPQKESFSKLNIPVLTLTGYFDDDQQGAMSYYKEHLKNNPSAINYLVIGPFDHGGAQSRAQPSVMNYTLDKVAAEYNSYTLRKQWYDYIFNGKEKPELLKDKVNFQIMGSNEWKHVPSLSQMANDTLTFYLSNSKEINHYTFSKVPNSKSFINQTVDLADRSDSLKIVPLIAGVSSANIIDSSIITSNAVVFISEPINESLSVSGSMVASIAASVNKRDFDVGYSLYELRPDGTYFSLGAPFMKNMQRASYASDKTKRKLLTPGKKVTIPINNGFITSKKLEKGSMLVLVLGVVKNLDWQINYGSGKDVSDETIADAGEPMQIKWFGDSWIKVPVLRD